MPQYVRLPDGNLFPLKEGEDPASALSAAEKLYPQAFGLTQKAPEEQPKSGFMPALKAGVSSLKGDIAGLAGRAGIMDLPAAEKYRAEQEAYQKKTFAPTQEGFLEAPFTKIGELAGGSLPYMVAPAAAAFLAPEGLAAAGAAGLASAAQFTGSNISRQVQEGKKLGETDVVNAALAAIPMAALDTVSLGMIPGMGKMFGKLGFNLSEKAAQDLAKEGLKKTAADYLLTTGRTMGVEGLTEAGQQVFERMQAGLNINDPEARKEYFDNFIGGAVLGGILAPVGRRVERGAEQSRFDKQQREEQKKQADVARVEQDKLDAATLATKQTPEYAQKAQADYVAAEQRQKELEGQIHKASKGNKLTEDQKQDNRETQQALAEHATVLKDTNKEYRQYRQFLPKEPAPAPEAIKNTEQLQQVDMFGNLPTPKTPELDLQGKPVERTGTAEDVLAREKQDNLYGPESKQAQLQQTFDMYDATVGNRGKFNAPETLLAQNDPRQQVRMLEQLVAQFQTQAPTLTLEQLQTAQPKFAQAVDALAQAREAVKKLPKPEEQQIAVAQKQLANAETNGDIDAQIALRIKLKDLQSRVVPKTQQEFEMQPFQATSETREQFRDRRSKELGDQRAETLARLDAEYDAAYAEHTRKLGESQALQRIGARPAGAISASPQFDLFEQPYPNTGASTALNQVKKVLTQGEELPTAEETQPAGQPQPQRGGPAPFKLRPRQEGTAEPVTAAAALRDRVNQLQLREDLSDEAYAFLRRADANIGEKDTAIGNEASLFTMLDEQLGKIERGEEGVYGEGAPTKRAETTARGGEGKGAMAEALRESGAALPSTVTGLPGSVTTPTAAEKVSSGFAGRTYNLSDSERTKALAKVRKEKYEQLVGEGVPKNEAARRASLIKQEDVAQGVMTSAGPTVVGVRGRAETAPAMNADQALKAAIAANPKAAQQANVQRAAKQLENIGTMRGPSAKAKPLSLPRELETHLRVKEELAQSEKDIDQMSLFPEKEVPTTALGRATPGMFRRFLDSKIVKEMREAEARTKVHKQQAPKVTYYFGLINELEAKLNALVTESDLRGTAKSILKDNDDVVALLQQYGKLKADPMFSSILAMTSVDNEKEIKALTQDVAVYTKTLAELDKQAAEARQAVAKRKEQIDRLNKMLSGVAPLETKLEAATAQLRELQKKGAAPAPEKTQAYKNEIASLKRQIESKLGFGEIGYEAPAFVFGQEDTQTIVMFEAALKKIKDNRVLVDTLQRQNKKLRQEMSQFSKLRTTAENTQAMLADLRSTLNSVSKTQDNIDKIPAVMDAQKTLWDLEHSGKDPEVLKKEIAQAQVDLRNAVVAKEEADAASKEAAKSPSTKAYEQAAAAVKKRRAGIEAQLATLRDQARAQRTKEENVRLYGAKQKTALPGGISVAPITSTTYAGKVQNQITNAAMDNIDAIEKEINELKQELEDKQKEGLPGKPQQMQIMRLESALQEANEFYNEQLKTEGIAKSNKEYAKQILAWPLKKLKLELGTLENQANALEDKVKAARAESLSHFEKQKAKEAGLVTFASLPPGKYPEVSKVKVSQLIPSERNKTPGGARSSPVFAFKGQGAAFRQTEILRLKRDSVAQRIEQVEALERQGKTAEETETQAPQRKASERGNVAPSSVTRTGPVTRGVTSNVAKLTESKRSGRPISNRQQQLERLQANIDAAQIKANEAAINWKKATEAYEASKGQPAQVREDAKAAYEAADNRLEISRSNLDAAKALLEAEDITKEQQEKLGAVSEATQTFENVTNERLDSSESNPIPKKTPAVLSPTVKKTAKESPKLSQQDIDDAVAAKGRQIDKKYGTEMDTSSPYHGKTYAEAARIAAEKARNPLSKKLFDILAEVLGNAYSDDMHGRVYVTSKKGIEKSADGKERPVAGHYNPAQNYVLTISTAGSPHATKILLHELLHAATSRGLYTNNAFNARVEHLKNTVEKWLQTPEGKKYFRANKVALVGFTTKGVYGLTNTHEFLAETFSHKGFQDLLDQIPSETPNKSVLSRLVDVFAGFFRFSKPKERSLLNDALEITEEAFAENKPLNEMQRWQKTRETNEVLNAPDYASDDALSELARDTVAQDKTFFEKLGGNKMLQFEQNTVDMRAGLSKAMELGAKQLGDSRLFQQAMYSVRKADQKMPLVLAALSDGPLETYTDDKGFKGVRTTNANSAKDIFASVSDIPDRYGDGKAKMGLATAYMIAQRAANKGLTKLDLGALGVTQEKLDAAMRQVDSDKQLKNALERTRNLYNKYNEGMIRFLASTGAITKKEADSYLKEGDYVPYYRVNDNGIAQLVLGGDKTITIGDIRHQPYLAELKGGETKILPLDKSLPRNTMLLVDMAMTNMATRNVAYAMQAAGKGQGEFSARTGKVTDLMSINRGDGPTDPSVIRWKQEADPNKPDDNGKRWLRVQTNDTVFGGIPAELIVKSLEGASLTLPAFLKLGSIAGDFLRAGVTRTPVYLLRQLFRDPFAAAATAGLDYGPLKAIYKAGSEYLKMNTGQSETAAKLLEKGLIQSGIFTGDPDDLSKFALQLASGKDMNAFEKFFAMADRQAMKADAATRALVYDNAIANGLSEVEADFAVMESMNFHKRGMAPGIQYASRLIPFFNSQIQGLNVLFKAASGNMPFNEQLKIKQKFYNNAMLLMGTGLAYAMLMDDDEYFRNAKPRDKYSNFFVHVPGMEEPLKLPIPYEFGWFFSAAVAAADAMKAETDGPQQLRALRDMFVGAIPGSSSLGVPQIVKPLAEVYTNKNFFSGFEATPLESARLQKLSPEARYYANTTELAKQLSKIAPVLSPIQIEHLVSGYLGSLPLMAAAATDSLFKTGETVEAPTRRPSEMPLIGSSFQRKYGGEDADVVYKLATDALQKKATFDNYRKTGKLEDAKEFLADHRAEIMVAPMAMQYEKFMGTLRKQEEIIRGSNIPADKKQERIDQLNKQRQLQSERYVQAIKRAEAASGRTTPQ